MRGILIALLLICASAAHAQSAKVTKVIVPFAPGGNIDAIARLFASRLSESLSETWIVENISGGNGVIGTQALSKMSPDGHNLLFVADAHAMAPLLIKNVPYDPLRDFTPVARVARAPLMLIANPDRVRVTQLRELLADLQSNAKNHAFSNGGIGTWPHLLAELIKSRTGDTANLIPNVAYRGTGPAMAAVVSGEVSLMFISPLAAVPLVKAGRLRAIAVTSSQRFEGTPDVPTATESGLQNFNFTNSYAFWAPKQINPDIVTRLSNSIRHVVANKELRGRLLDMGVSANFEPPEVFAAAVAEESQRTFQLIKQIGIQPQ